jgi:hypothetical protein
VGLSTAGNATIVGWNFGVAVKRVCERCGATLEYNVLPWGWSAPLRRPIGKGGTRKHKYHADFRIDVRQEVRNPPRGMGVPIDEGWIAS